MSTWRPCPNGCGKDVRSYWPDGVFDGEPTPDANDCLWCEGSFNSGAAVAFGIMGMAEAIRARRRKCPTCRCTISIMQAGCSCCADTDADVDYEPFI